MCVHWFCYAGEVSARSLYGPKGPIQRHEVPDSKRMPASRAAVLIANAMAAGVAECWLAKQPVLLMGEFVREIGTALPECFLEAAGRCKSNATAAVQTETAGATTGRIYHARHWVFAHFAVSRPFAPTTVLVPKTVAVSVTVYVVAAAATAHPGLQLISCSMCRSWGWLS